MTHYNFMSGSSIDNASSFVFDALDSGKCYLGFSKGRPEMQWGVNTLIMIEQSNFPLNVASSATSGTSVSNLFFDHNSLNDIPLAPPENRNMYIGFVPAGSPVSSIQYVATSGIGTLSLQYIGKDWMVVQGMNKYYYNILNQPASAGDYYIVNYMYNDTIAVKILPKSMVSVPYFVNNCSLWYKPTVGDEYILGADGLQRTINMLGEIYITGLLAPEEQSEDSIFNTTSVSAADKKNILKNAYSIVLRDESGNIIMENLSFVDVDETSTTEQYTEITSLSGQQKYITLMYSYINNEPQYVKLVIGQNELDELAIWNEELPFASIVPTSDSNPPALDVSYLKNPLLSNSIFDVNGLSKVNAGEYFFIKEMNNVDEKNYYTSKGLSAEDIILHGSPTEHTAIVKTAAVNGDQTISVFNNNGFVVGDTVFIKYDFADNSANPQGQTYTVSAVDYTDGANSITFSTPLTLLSTIPVNAVLMSNPSEVEAVITIAKTTDKDVALKYGFYNVLISKTVPLIGVSSPTEKIYRQLFLCYKPKDSNGVECSASVYNGDNSVYGANFNRTTWKYDNGLILYLANKVPIYRKWANVDEEFKIII